MGKRVVRRGEDYRGLGVGKSRGERGGEKDEGREGSSGEDWRGWGGRSGERDREEQREAWGGGKAVGGGGHGD